jgi:superfamily II DNA or RNA helicase
LSSSDLTLIPFNAVHMVVGSEDAAILQELSEYFRFAVPGAQFIPAVKNHRWDGMIRMYNRDNSRMYIGLAPHVEAWAKERGYTVENLVSFTQPILNAGEMHRLTMWNQRFRNNLPPHITSPHDYQWNAFKRTLKQTRGVILSPTGSGKSLILYMIATWRRFTYKDKILLVVPTIGLVDQMKADFEDYGWHTWKASPVGFRLQTIRGGLSKDVIDAAVVISTWQSISKLPAKWFEQFTVILGDECHGFKAKQLSGLMDKSKNAHIRWGLTGTLDDMQSHRWMVEGVFGPAVKMISTHELQTRGELAPIRVKALYLRYHRNDCKRRRYQEEMDLILSSPDRLSVVSKLAVSGKSHENTLVLFNFVDRHGIPLHEAITRLAPDPSKVRFVSGATPADDREQIRRWTEMETGVIIVASYGTFSTGINIRRLHRVILAAPSKSRYRILQTIGRGLRTHAEKVHVTVFDLIDDLRYGTYINALFDHWLRRHQFYTEEQFPVSTATIPFRQVPLEPTYQVGVLPNGTTKQSSRRDVPR